MPDQSDLQWMKPAQMRAELGRLLDADLTDTELRDRLEELAQALCFNGFTWLWGPRLYRRNRLLFRPFILSHFAMAMIGPKWSWEVIKWKGEAAAALDPWLEEVDAADDADLFRRLYPWKYAGGQWGGLDTKKWQPDLLARFGGASTPAARESVLRKFDIGAHLDEPAAIELYSVDRRAAGPFILRHSGNRWGENRGLWSELFDRALKADDEDFAYKLYRQQVSQKQWDADVRKLADDIDDSDALCAELDRRHPQGWDLQLGGTMYRLVDQRRRDVMPYLRKHLRSVYRSWYGGRDGYKQLVRFASDNEWWDLWSALLRTCSKPEEYNAAVKDLLKAAGQQPRESERRLLMLTGVSREWNFGPFGLAQVQQLEDDVAVKLYQQFPDLLRGPFKMHVSSGWHAVYPNLTRAVIKAEDEVLIDYLASRVVTRAVSTWGWGQEQVDQAEVFSKYYEQFRDDGPRFSRRAVQVLSQVPAYSIWNYNELVRTNRLARMFYQRSAASFLNDPQGVRDLLEAAEIHAQAVAFRVLGLDDDAARRLAAEHLDLLQATLLRPLHRKTRMLTFRALENAAVDLHAAERIHRRAREALDLPDKRYPKEQLVGLIGRLLHKWPELRAPEEQPVVYGTAQRKAN